MKIAFVNSSLESGRDGVGDYTRLLSQECVRQGHLCYRIALNDRFINEMQWTDNSDGVAELRLPAHWPWSKRIEQAQVRLKGFEPDWVSLQFVPYGFQPKGLIFGLAKNLEPLFAGRKAHIMFHELWIGEIANSSLNHRLVGTLQRRIIVDLTKRLAPDITHTSTSVYRSLLRKYAGITALPLPLFGNIAVNEEHGNKWLFTELRNSGVEISETNRTDFWLAGFFGSLPPNWPAAVVIPQLMQAADRHRRRLVILSSGNLVSGEALWQEMVQKNSPEVRFLKFGRLPSEKVSQYLNSLDFGLATTPYGRIGKSGSVAAMLDHGLPVIVSQDEGYRTVPYPPDIAESLLHRLEYLQDHGAVILKRQPVHARQSEIAAQFINDLRQATPEKDFGSPALEAVVS